MSRYPSEEVARFDQQFAETPYERNERQRAKREDRSRTILRVLIADLSPALSDEGADWSIDGLIELRRRVANALEPRECPEWLRSYRDLQTVQP